VGKAGGAYQRTREIGRLAFASQSREVSVDRRRFSNRRLFGFRNDSVGPDEDKRYLEMISAFHATTTSPSLTVASNNGRRLKGNRKFVDSPQEETGFEISVPRCARTADSVTVV